MLYHILHRINLRKSGILNDVSTTLNDVIMGRSTIAKQNGTIMVKQNGGIHNVNIPLITDTDNKN